MTSMSNVVPFGSLVDQIQNKADDDFESSFDETYGDPMHSDNLQDGITLIGRTLAVLVLIVGILFLVALFHYGCSCSWFGRNRGNNNEGFLKGSMSLCCPRWFPRNSLEGDPQDLQGQSNSNANVLDDPTATDTMINYNSSDSDSSEDGGIELIENKLSVMTAEQKRSLFASVLDTRMATEADISEGTEKKYDVNENEYENNTTSVTAKSIVIPDGSPQPPSDDDNNTTTCCPICIQDIKVGDRVCHSKRKNCHHMFHLDCILEWLGTGSTLCPYCRRDIFTRAMLEEALRNQQQQLVQEHRGV